MENRRVLRLGSWRSWSPVRKTQVVGMCMSAFVTAAFYIFDSLQIELPRNSWLSGFVFGIGLLLSVPGGIIGKGLGIPQGEGFWLWAALALLANSVLGFLIATPVGWVLSKFGRRIRSTPLHLKPLCFTAITIIGFISALTYSNCYAHDEPVHEEITKSAFKSSDGLGTFLYTATRQKLELVEHYDGDFVA